MGSLRFAQVGVESGFKREDHFFLKFLRHARVEAHVGMEDFMDDETDLTITARVQKDRQVLD